MDDSITLLRSIVTVLSFVTFIGLVWWAYSRRNASRFDDAAQLPFAHEDSPHATHKEETK